MTLTKVFLNQIFLHLGQFSTADKFVTNGWRTRQPSPLPIH